MHLTTDRRALLAGFAALGVPTAALAKAAASYPALQALLDSYVDGKKLPGAVIAVKHADDAPRFMSKGTLALDSAAPVGPTSLFRIYSMTKPIVGMATMKLIEEGKLKLDQPVSEILPELANLQVLKSPTAADMAVEPLARPITIRHLLTHTAGFSYSILPGELGKLYTKKGIVPGGRTRDKEPGADLAPVQNLDELVQRLATVPLGFQPGTRWSYSVSFDLLGLVIQRASGMPFRDYMKTRFFTPLKMVDTDFIAPAGKLDRLTSVNAVKDGVLTTVDDRKASPFARDTDLPSGGGGLVSTAADYIRFTTMLLNGGTLDGRRVLKAETVKLATSNLLPQGVIFRGFAPNGPANGFGAGGWVILPEGAQPGGEPAGSFSWFGIAGTQMWVDFANRTSVVAMLQMYPNRLPIQGELRTAAYRDLAALKT